MKPREELTGFTNLKELTSIRTANKCLEEAEILPELKPLFGTLWQTGELTFLAGDTGKGKTVLAVSIADAISKGSQILLGQPVGQQSKVLYYDFELNDRQFSKRYLQYQFDDRFYRVVVNPFYLGDEKFSLETIRRDIKSTGAEIIILDNISALSLRSTQNQDEALLLMRGLKSLTMDGLSVLILAHTPKVVEGTRLNINHLAGSKQLSNFADSVFFIASSCQNPDYRYLKQVKCRNAGQMEEVLICELTKEDGHLSFDLIGFDHEDLHLAVSNPIPVTKITEEMIKAIALHKQGKSYREIAALLGVGKSTVDRWVKNQSTIPADGTLGQRDGTVEGTEKLLEIKKKPMQSLIAIPKDKEKKPISINFGNKKKQESDPSDGTTGHGDNECVLLVNGHLKNWIYRLLQCSKQKSTSVARLKQLEKDIQFIQQSEPYRKLPPSYENFVFIQNMKTKVQLVLETAKKKELDSVKIDISEEYTLKLKTKMSEL